MRIVKNMNDLSFDEDEQFFADIIKEAFDCDLCYEDVKSIEALKSNARPLNDFNIYTTAQPSVEGIRMISWADRMKNEKNKTT